MEALIFAPTLLCLVGFLRWGVQRTFLNVCLPVLLLLPTYFFWKMNGVPGLDFSLAVLLPLGVGLFAANLHKGWKFGRTDLWMLLYVISSTVADLRIGETSLAKYRLFDVILAAVIPYMAGKLLIEQLGARRETAQRIILVLCLCCVAAAPEFVLKLNLFERIGMHLFPGQWPGWWTQIRWGFGRVAGPFGTAEVFGMILILGVLFLLWLRMPGQAAAELETAAQNGWLASKKGCGLALLLLAATLLMTQSRGPWLGALLAVPIALVGRARRVGRAALLLAVVYVCIAVPAYIAGNHYTSGTRQDYGSEKETAQYRRELIVNYLPLAERGGVWGWGTFHPVVNGQPSIDNEFLRVFLVQGYAGLLAYVLLMVESGYALVRVGLSSAFEEDRRFCFTMLGILAGWAVTLFTVYMGGQSYELFFLLVGWAQAVPRVRVEAPRAVQAAASQPLAPQLTRIYS